MFISPPQEVELKRSCCIFKKPTNAKKMTMIEPRTDVWHGVRRRVKRETETYISQMDCHCQWNWGNMLHVHYKLNHTYYYYTLMLNTIALPFDSIFHHIVCMTNLLLETIKHMDQQCGREFVKFENIGKLTVHVLCVCLFVEIFWISAKNNQHLFDVFSL